MRCTIETCAGEAVEPVAITSSGNYNELLCGSCAVAWRSSPDFKLAAQLLALGRTGAALSQYQHWKAVQAARLGSEL